MERYLGIDPHRDSCTLALVSPKGKKVKQMVVPTEGSSPAGPATSARFGSSRHTTAIRRDASDLELVTSSL